MKAGIKNLGFDIDDVISDFWQAAIPIFNKKYGVCAIKSDFVKFESMNTIYEINDYEFHETIIDSGVLEIMKPYPGVPEIMQKIAEQGHAITLITSRGYHPNAKALTLDFLKSNNIPFNSLYIKEDGKTKADYISHEIDYFVDDLPKNLHDVKNSGKSKKLGLIDQPWNKDELGFKRYKSLSHFFKSNFQEKIHLNACFY